MRVKVSVVVTVYNTEQYLHRCLDSIANQSLREIEVVVVNDGSPDGSAAILAEAAARDARIRAVETPNGGVSKARNLGMDLAAGEFVIFIDSDDYIHPDMLEKLYESAVEHNADMAVCNASRVYADGRISAPIIDFHGNKLITPRADHCGYIRKIFSQEESLAGGSWNKLFRLGRLRESGVRYLDRADIYAEDAVFLYQVLPHMRTISVVDQPMYFYYQHEASVSHNYKEAFAARCERLITVTVQYYRSLGLYDAVKEGIYVKSFAFLLEILYNESMQGKSCQAIRNAVENRFFMELAKKADISHFSRNQKFVYFLYRHKQVFLLNLLFKLKRGGVMD